MATDVREQLQATLGRTFTLERELGGGGMSRVFVAHDGSLGRRIVVKVLPPELTGGVNVERFRREILLAASLLHPHIISLLSAGEIDGLPYYTMPFVEGESLRAYLTRSGELAVDEAVRIACEVAGALDYAHRRGVVHRDIKPENILLHDGHALVTDFGIARAISQAVGGSELTGIGVAVGTPKYMSPEQGSGERELDGRSDIYALGCVLYEMLVGWPPFTGLSAQAIIVRHLTDPVPRAGALRIEIPAGVDRALATALAKAPSDRFATAAEFARALDERSAEPPARAHPVAAGRPRAPAEPDRFVAVLPFENMSADPENEYFSDGITEDIIAQLAKIPRLRVVSRTSVMRYKAVHPGVRDLARDLGVSHVLEGSVRRAGSRLRIVAQLCDARTDEHLWAETYDRDLVDVFAIQTEVAERIAEKLHARLSTTDRARIGKKPTDDLEAYNLYLLGRHHYNKVTPADFAKAVDYYRRCIARDPGFARAYASLAEALLYMGFGYWGVRPHDVLPEAYDLATKALGLDPYVAEAHASLGMYAGWYQYDWARAGSELDRAVELNPSAPMIRMYRAIHLAALGRFDDAVADRDAACQLDPSAMAIRGNATWILYLTGRMEQAVSECRSLRELEPSSAYGAFSHGLVCAQGGDPREAVAAFRDAVRLSERASLYLVMLAYALAVAGEHEEAREVLRDVRARSATEYVWPMGLAMAHAHLGETEAALDYLEYSYEERVGWMALLGREPALDVLRREPRFRTLLRQIGPPILVGG